MKDLTNNEKLIMKVVWDANEDISTSDVIEQLNIRFGKDYARTTVITYIQRLIGKGFVKTYRKGKMSYIHPIQSEAKYQERIINEMINFWFDGKPEQLVAALCVLPCKENI